MEFGKKLKFILEYEAIQYKDFAELLNLAPATISGYINNGRQPDFEILKKMASALNVSIDYLLDYNSDSSGSPPISITELTLLTRLRSLPKEKQEIIYKMAEYLTEKPKN